MAENLEERITIGREAKRLLNDPLFNGVINVLLKDAIHKLGIAKPGSEEAMAAHCSMLSLNEIKTQLKVVENDGTMAYDKLKKRQQD